MRRTATPLFLLAVALAAQPLRAQGLDGLTLESPNPGDRGAFGRSVAGVPDANGDGRGDLLIGAFTENGGADEAGRAYLVSGIDGTALRTLVSPNPRRRGLFGRSVAGVPDVDGDGRGDLLVGAALEDGGATSAGRAYLFSGATGVLLRTLVSPNAEASGVFGNAVSGVPDADGDGRGDLLVGASSESAGADDSGQAYLFSGATGALLATLTSPNAKEDGTFGTSVAGVPDADGDGRGDLLVGAETEDGGADGSGRAYLFSGATGALLASVTSPSPMAFSQFGNWVAGVPDTDGDGRGDLLVAEVTGGADFRGRAYLFSGATGALLHSLASPFADASNFGRSVSGVSDVDGDGRGELLVGESLTGRAHLFNGATGDLLVTVTSRAGSQFQQFGDAVAGVPDVDGDGSGDLLVGAFAETVNGVQTDGRAYLFYTAVLVDTEEAIERTAPLAITGVRPNPLRAQATLTLDVRQASHVSVAVYDALGREVARLHDGPLAAGAHPLALDASRLPSGVYLVRAAAEAGVVTRRVTIVR